MKNFKKGREQAFCPPVPRTGGGKKKFAAVGPKKSRLDPLTPASTTGGGKKKK